MDSFLLILIVLAPVVIVIQFLKWRRRRKRDAKLEALRLEQYRADLLRQKRDHQLNIGNRLRNAFRRVPDVSVERSELFEGSTCIIVKKLDGGVPSKLSLTILLNLVTEGRSNHIYVSYRPSLASGWFGSDENQIEELLSVATNYFHNPAAV